MGSQFIFIMILGLAPQALCFRALPQKSEISLRSANGAEYDSQGQGAEQSEARRPWVHA